MKYKNAKDILPAELLDKVQEYACGEIIYIPTCKEKRSWGEKSGYKEYLIQRNCEIREKYILGVAMEHLASEYYLSVESIKKIVYSKKEKTDSMKEKKYDTDITSHDFGSVEKTIKNAYNAMSKKGYDPINQFVGYIVTGDSGYITSHENARSLVNEFEIDDILREIFTAYFKRY